jgi:hypothetical protein
MPERCHGVAGQNELLGLALGEVLLLISRTGGFPNSRLYSRLNYEGAFIADATAYRSIIFRSFRRMRRAS